MSLQAPAASKSLCSRISKGPTSLPDGAGWKRWMGWYMRDPVRVHCQRNPQEVSEIRATPMLCFALCSPVLCLGEIQH